VRQFSDRFGILALHCLIWTLPFGLYYVFEQPSVSQRFYLQIAVSTIALFYFASCWLGRRLGLPRNAVLGAAILYGLCTTASSIGARSGLFTIKQAAFLWCCVLLLAVITHLRLSRRQCRQLLASFVFIAGICALYGVVQYLGIDIHWGGVGYADEVKMGKYYVLSLMGHPNYVTAYIGPALLLCPGLIAASPGRRMKTALGVTAGIIALCIFVAGTRSAWLGTLLVGGVLIALVAVERRPLRISRRVLGVAFVVACVFSLFIIQNPLVPQRYSFTRRLTEARPVESRLYFYVAAIRMIAKHPLLGVGYNNYGVEFWDYTATLQENPDNRVYSYILEDMGGIRADQTHNEYLQIAAETGLLGLATFFLLVVVFFGRCWNDYRHARIWHDRLLLAGMAGAVAFLLVDCLFSFPLRLPCSSFVFWLALGIGSRYARPETLVVSAGKEGQRESQAGAAAGG